MTGSWTSGTGAARTRGPTGRTTSGAVGRNGTVGEGCTRAARASRSSVDRKAGDGRDRPERSVRPGAQDLHGAPLSTDLRAWSSVTQRTRSHDRISPATD